MSVLVYTEHTEGKFKKSAYEVVSYAKAIADRMDTSVTAISIGSVESSELAALGKYGATDVLHVASDQLAQFINQAYASVLAAAAESTGAAVVVFSNTFSGKSTLRYAHIRPETLGRFSARAAWNTSWMR